ncbi:MAG: hypothetical protein PHI68_08310 [Candidatus Cloacimonetes bacterium]|nr:hypothetical protein [Candidatus Cloacimonadota bacterium]
MLLQIPEFSETDLCAILQEELSVHPLSQLQDLFKLVYQAYNGPSHLTGSALSIAQSIEKEIRNLHGHKSCLIQDIGNGKAFVRINLAALSFPRFRLVETISECIVKSRFETELSREEMLQQWKRSLAILKDMGLDVLQDQDLIIQSIESGLPISHSQTYKQQYQPSYRIIHSSYIPLLQEGINHRTQEKI